ncbi:hypothetical protein POPTR_011G044012v4 [Populus trichocarpa]|uniref:Uncharacterized protein n=1 Tax=Populus trichocarpa TaxID=3694 RepID=A0ACC0S7I2_POPTR|nr:hypothetical protein POPTR_011G044012v4 [Populus trichocarpa]
MEGYAFRSVGFEGVGIWTVEICGFFQASVGWKEVPLTDRSSSMVLF